MDAIALAFELCIHFWRKLNPHFLIVYSVFMKKKWIFDLKEKKKDRVHSIIPDIVPTETNMI